MAAKLWSVPGWGFFRISAQRFIERYQASLAATPKGSRKKAS
jgi:hypothetical protein